MSLCIRFITVILSVCAPVAALAAEKSSHFFWEVSNLLILVTALILLTRKPVTSYFQTRRSQVEESVRSAESLLQKAEERLGEWELRASRMEDEVKEIRRVAMERATNDCKQLVLDSRATAERNEGNARNTVEREVRKARQVLRAEAVELALELASDRLRQGVTEEDHSRIVDEFVEHLEHGGRDPRSPNG